MVASYYVDFVALPDLPGCRHLLRCRARFHRFTRPLEPPLEPPQRQQQRSRAEKYQAHAVQPPWHEMHRCKVVQLRVSYGVLHE